MLKIVTTKKEISLQKIVNDMNKVVIFPTVEKIVFDHVLTAYYFNFWRRSVCLAIIRKDGDSEKKVDKDTDG